jgi:hypothetical protein
MLMALSSRALLAAEIPSGGSPGASLQRQFLSGVGTEFSAPLVARKVYQLPPPQISGFTPTHGDYYGVVTIYGKWLIDPIGVSFGGVPATFFINTDGSISAYQSRDLTRPQPFVPASVPISVTLADGTTVTSPSPYSYDPSPIASLTVTGPHPWDASEIGDTWWFNGGGHNINISNAGTLQFGTMSPVVHIETSFSIDPLYTESNSPGHYSLGNGGGIRCKFKFASWYHPPLRLGSMGSGLPVRTGKVTQDFGSRLASFKIQYFPTLGRQYLLTGVPPLICKSH